MQKEKRVDFIRPREIFRKNEPLLLGTMPYTDVLSPLVAMT